jgi:hypothetical protein
LQWSQRERKNSFFAIEEDQVASFTNGVPRPIESASHSTTVTEHFAHKIEEDEVEQFNIDDGGQLRRCSMAAKRLVTRCRCLFGNLRREQNASPDKSSQGPRTLKVLLILHILKHAGLRAHVSNPNLEAFDMWGIDPSGSFDGLLSILNKTPTCFSLPPLLGSFSC